MNPQLIDQLKRHEGFRAHPYLCPAGHRTVGYGHNLDASPLVVPEDGLTEAQATRILEDDAARVWKAVSGLVTCFDTLTDARQAVLINMAFNIGWAGLGRFEKMLAALNGGDYERAANEMLCSRWARQVKNRAYELVGMMRTGEWA